MANILIMKIKDIIGHVLDIDVYDDYTEELAIAYCGGNLTEQGEIKFGEVLELDCILEDGIVVVEIDKLPNGERERMLDLAIEMFSGMAGYCGVSCYEKYFIEDDE